MGYPWKELSPKDGFIVRQNSLFSDIDQKVLTFLYQPLIGTSAYSLYMAMWTEVDEVRYWSEGILHSELLTLLNMGIPEFYRARIKLEAIGLLKTYLKQKPEKQYMYELQTPVSSEAFFKDDLLSLLLLEQVGERKFRNLRNRFTVAEFDKDNFQDITKEFLDVYHFDGDSLKKAKNVLKDPVPLVGGNNQSAPLLSTHTFDFKFFYESLSSHYINRSSITKELEKTIIVLHTMYGVDEMAMQRYILEASDIENGTVNEQKLKKVVSEYYRAKNGKNVSLKDVAEKDVQLISNKEQSRKYELQHQGLSNEEVAIIEASEKINPLQFIQSIKEQKGGFVTKNEEWTLEEIVKQANLPTAVINILIHYILVIKNSPTFEKGLGYKIANDWAQSKVLTPEDAILKVKKLYQENAERNQQRPPRKQASSPANTGYRTQQNTRKETLPEWARQEHAPAEEKPMSEAEQSSFMERLKKIQSFRKEGE